MNLYNGFTDWPDKGWCALCEQENARYGTGTMAGDECPNCGEARLLTRKQKALYLRAVDRWERARKERAYIESVKVEA